MSTETMLQTTGLNKFKYPSRQAFKRTAKDAARGAAKLNPLRTSRR